ncbi:MAG: UPF0489 family protein [Theionarchaea archaeon]|nr:UPF0489 family protein [Theionarchaea archaeon]MBU7037942.1 UPF0489 family protein [Theionarchaea archaeon]
MKRVLAILLIVVLASQVQCTLFTSNPYMIAHSANHKDAYLYWRIARERGLIQNGMTLVHFDAHSDMDCMVGDYYDLWLATCERGPDKVEGVTNATFISAAVGEGLVTEIWWVVPDYRYWRERFDSVETFISNGEPRTFYKYVKFCDCEKEEDHVVCALMQVHQVAPPLLTLDMYEKTETRVHFVTLGMLPHFEKEVLLDVDTDYFINALDIDRYPDYFYNQGEIVPWITIDRFMRVLNRIRINSRVVTIAVSPPYAFEEYHYLSYVVAEELDRYLSLLYPSEIKERFQVE